MKHGGYIPMAVRSTNPEFRAIVDSHEEQVVEAILNKESVQRVVQELENN